MIQSKKFKHILGGKEFTFWLGLGFLSSFLKESGTTIETFDKALTDNPFDVIPIMVYCSMKYGYDRVGAELDFTKFEVVEWIDESGGVQGDFVVMFLKKFGEAMTNPNDEKAKEDKPKINGKKSQKKTQTLK